MVERLCVKRDGKSYYWNLKTGEITVSFEEVLAADTCPAKVLWEFMMLARKEMIGDKPTALSKEEVDQLLSAINASEC